MISLENIKNIAILHPTFGYNGGAENVILSTIKGFYNKGINTDIYTFKIRENVDNYIKQYKTDITLNPFIFNKTARYLAHNLQKYDAVIIHNFPATIFFYFAVKYANKNNIQLPKSFWYCHEPSVRLYGYDKKSYEKLKHTLDPIAQLTMYIDKKAIKSIDYIIANSIRTKNHIKTVYNRDAEVIYPCISNDISYIPINNSKHFLYIGRIEKNKNLDNAIFAFKDFIYKAKNNDIKFIIAGKGRYKESIEQLVYKLNMQKNIIIKGFVSEEEKKELLNNSYALIMPAINEPFGLTVIEALYYSCLSILSSKSGVYEVVQDCSISADMSSIDDISQKISFVYNNIENIKEDILSKSKGILNNFTLEQYCINILKYISDRL